MNKYGTVQKVGRCKGVCLFLNLCEFADILTVVYTENLLLWLSRHLLLYIMY